jgi:hypothetical protein
MEESIAEVKEATARTGSRFLPFGFAQGRNDRQKGNGKSKSRGGICRVASLSR